MTLLQTRVDDRVASQFEQAAKSRSMSKYQLLSVLVKKAATDSMKRTGWKEHRAWMRARNRVPLKQNAVVMSREGEDR